MVFLFFFFLFSNFLCISVFLEKEIWQINASAQRVGIWGQLLIFGMSKKAIAAFRKAIHLKGIKFLTLFVSLETHFYF